jgi:DNA topoisomerase IB
MKFYQLNNLEKKESKFFNEQKEQITINDLPKDIQKVALGFPKAVLFYPPLKGKIYAYAIDNAGRKQYFYTKKYTEKTEGKKFNNFIRMIERVNKLLEYCYKHTNDITTSIILMDECNFRIGHEKYKKLYGTNGALTLTKNHIKKTNNKIQIEFLGKKKEINTCVLDNEESHLYKILDKFLSKNNNNLFQEIKYDDVYSFIKKYKIKPKDIRQVGANRQFYLNIKRMRIKGDTKKDIKEFLKKVLEITSSNMNHTAAVCKKKYLIPNWFEFKGEEIHKLKKYISSHDFLETVEYVLKYNLNVK